MRYLLIVPALVCLFAGVSSTRANTVPDSIAYQGRLTDASDTPVPDGPRDLVLSFWSDSVGGTMLYTEVRAVNVKNGLYSACIGCNNDSFFDIFTDSSIYLEVQLAGEPPMTPRTPIRYTPKAMMSARVRGDISTSPDHLTIGDLDGDGMLDLVSTADLSEMTIARKRPGKVKFQNITLRAYPDSTTDTRDCDDDDDGDPESAYQQRLTPTTSSLAIKTKGTSAQRLSMGGDCDDTDASVYVDGDDDGDGVPERDAELRITPTTASLAINSKGTSAKRLRAGGDCDDTDASFYLDYDDDGDGVSETSMTSTVERKSGSIIYLDREGNEVLRSMMGVDSTRSVVTLDRDSDGDGVPEDEISSTLVPGMCAVAIKTKGTAADANRVVGSTDDTTASVLLAADSASISMRTKHGGVIKGAININHANRSMVDVSVEDTATSIASSLDLDGDAQQDVGILEACTADSTIREVTYAYPNSAAPVVLMKAKEKANRTKCGNNLRQISSLSITETEVGCDSAGASTFWRADDFSGAITSVTIQATTNPSANPIEHSSGAHLTSGGVWTNASDVNLKENFQPVDGAELLDRIEQLSISEWNYKTESDEVRHIGPTAQDFKETFGVGADDKSISTIDPSGIALAAIKELSKQNQELRSQNLNLQKQLDELKQMVEQLAAKK